MFRYFTIKAGWAYACGIAKGEFLKHGRRNSARCAPAFSGTFTGEEYSADGTGNWFRGSFRGRFLLAGVCHGNWREI